MVRGKQDAWDPQICLSWGERFLTWIKGNIESASGTAPGSVWRVKFMPRVGVEFALLSEEERREVEAGEDRVGFLPKWYYTEIRDGVSSPSARRSASGAGQEQSRSSALSASIDSTLPAGWQI